MLNVLILILIIEFIFALIFFRNDFISPAVILSAVFLAAAIDLTLMIDYWNIELIYEAVCAIGIGNAAFILTAYLVRLVSKKRIPSIELQKIYIDPNIILLIDVVYMLVIGVYMLFIVLAARRYGATGSIFSTIGFVQGLSSDVEVGMPSVVSKLYNLCINMSYIWIYIFVRNWDKSRKPEIKWVLLVVMSICIGMIANGARGDLVATLFCAVVFYILIYRKQHNKSIPMKYYIRIGIAVIVLVFLFQWIGSFLGRDSGRYQFVEYLSIYSGGPIMNFSNALKAGMPTASLWGAETFHRLYTFLGALTGNGAYVYKTDRRFWVANGHNVGNVATMYYDYYHDFGMIGCIVIPIIMAVVTQYLYERVKKQKKQGISVLMITYAWMLFMLLRSFFSNMLVYSVCSPSFIKQLVVWIIVSKLITRLRLKIR